MAKKFLVAIDLNKNELQNAVLQNLAIAPENAKNGQAYYDTAENRFSFYENGAWVHYATLAEMQEALNGKVDVATYEGKVQELQTAIDGKANQSDFESLQQEFNDYKTTVDGLDYVNSEQYRQDQEALNNKDTELEQKIDGVIADTYTKQEVDDKIAEKDSLPAQDGMSGKFLTTDGTTAAWADAVASVNGETGNVVVTAIQDSNTGSTMIKLWVGSKEQYDALDVKDENTLYYIQKDGEAIDVYELLDQKQNKLVAGDNISLSENEDGTVTIAGTYNYTLPVASADTLGGIKVGANLSIDENGVLSASSAVVSVNGQTGVVVLDKVSVGLENVDNTADKDKPISDATQAALDGKADKATTLAGYGIADAYTKEEIDAKVSSVYKFKGSVEAVADLPTEGNIEGDVYNVKATGENYAWVAATDNEPGHWDDLGGDIDLTPYLTAEQIAEAYLNKTDAANTYLAKTDAAETYATKDELAAVSGGAVHKVVALNDELTPAGGVATWTVEHTFGADVVVTVKEVATNEEVITDVITTENTVTIKMNTSSNVTAGTYKVVLVG
jgi:hypothetical protein